MPTSRVCATPKDNGSVLVLLGTQNVVELECETVQVANVERAKVVVECIVKELVVDGKVAGRLAARSRCCGSIHRSHAPLVWRPLRRFRVGKVGIGCRGMRIRCEI